VEVAAPYKGRGVAHRRAGPGKSAGAGMRRVATGLESHATQVWRDGRDDGRGPPVGGCVRWRWRWAELGRYG
jgi:hypothetical protein